MCVANRAHICTAKAGTKVPLAAHAVPLVYPCLLGLAGAGMAHKQVRAMIPVSPCCSLAALQIWVASHKLICNVTGAYHNAPGGSSAPAARHNSPARHHLQGAF